MAAKRPAPDTATGTPATKKPNLSLSTLDIGPAAGEEDLDTKVLQVQNRKLSERLRERNRCREQLEQQVFKLEKKHEDHIRLRSALKQHFTSLREHLLVAMAAVGDEEGDHSVLSEESVEEVCEVDGFRKFSQLLVECVKKVCRRKVGTEGSHPPEGAQEDDQGQVRSRMLALLEEFDKRDMSTNSQHLQESASIMETKCEELEEEVANLRFTLEQSQIRGDRLEARLESALAELQMRPVLRTQPSEEGVQSVDEGQEGSTTASIGSAAEGGTGSDSKSTTDETESVQGELQEAKDLNQSRLEEIQKLSTQLAEAKKEMDALKISQQPLPEALVKESAPYKSLQAQFSIAALEASQMRSCLDEAKALLVQARQQHFSQLEEIRAEEVKYQMEVREEMVALETALASVKHDYEVTRMEFERTMASNEQAGPIAKELRVTVDSLEKAINQHKSEVNRYKARAHKAEQQVAKLQEEKEKEEKEKAAASITKTATSDLGKEEVGETCGKEGEGEESELEKTKKQLKMLEVELESFKQATSAEDRSKAEIINAEKKARGQIEELKRRFEDYRRDYEKRKEHIREEAARKTKGLTEDNRHLQKDLSAKKHEAQALVAEMECTAQAFEEMQEQNIRLLQQLKEKNDANFKLMSERIKSNSIHKLLLEEKGMLQAQLSAMAVERQRYVDLVSQLEERERTTEATLQTVDKELVLQQQTSEAHRKKAQESMQGLADVQLQVTDCQKQVEATQQLMASRTDEWEKESQLHKRSMEEVANLKKKLEKYKNREWMTAGDEVLLEEIKMYKAKLNCPCCSTRKKDTVLTKCFHVFCSECIKNRYDSRLRKCPKCGAAFGANDFHKIYLS